MKPKVYVETTIVSYLAARRSRNLIVRAHQELTRRWWRRRTAFEVFASPLVMEEAGRGDAAARIKRQRFLRDLPLLEITDDTRTVGRQLLARGPLPAEAFGGVNLCVIQSSKRCARLAQHTRPNSATILTGLSTT